MRTERLLHLDFLRAAMMFLGVLVHASHADYDLGDYGWVRSVSGSFRMACFFLISGYFSLRSLERHGPRFVARRLATLGIPALFSVLLLNPSLTEWMAEYFATSPRPATLAINWHGPMWFLFVLIVYTLATRRVASVLQASRGWLARVCPPGPADALLVVAVTACAGIGIKVLEQLEPVLPFVDAYRHIAQSTIVYLPYFVLGLVLQRSPAAFAFVHSRPWAWGGLAVGSMLVQHLLSAREITSVWSHLVYIGVDYAAGFSCTLALVSTAGRLLKRDSPVLRFAAESSYTLYVVHYFFVAIALVYSERLGFPLPARALCAAALAVAGGLSIHAALVARMPLFALLLNGRLPPARAAVEAPSPG